MSRAQVRCILAPFGESNLSLSDGIDQASEGFAERHFLRNASLLITENAGFSIAITFVGLTTVMPTFVTLLGGSPFLVGLIGACQTAGALLTQIIGARLCAGKARMKPYLLTPLYIGRPAILVVGILTFILGTGTNWLLLSVFFVALFVFFATDGVASVPWYELISKTVPPTRRGRMFGTAQIAGGLTGIAVGWAVSRILGAHGLPFPYNYALLFVISGILFVLNNLPFVFMKEPVLEGAAVGSADDVSVVHFLGSLGKILRDDANFVRVVAARLLFGVGFSVFPFYVLFMSKIAGYGTSSLGLFTSAQVFGGFVGGLLLGWVADRVGTRSVIRLASLVGAAIPGLGLIMFGFHDRLGHLLLVPAIGIFVLIGAAMSMNMIGFSNYILEAAPVELRPNYVGLFNTLAGTLLIASPLAGWLLDRTSYGVLFAVALAGSLLSLVISLGLHAPVRE